MNTCFAEGISIKMEIKQTVKALIIHHTYSNNTSKVASSISSSLQNMGCQTTVLSLSEAIENIPIQNPDLIILGTPAFYWTVPKGAMRLIKKLPEFKGSKAFVFCTFGGCVYKDILYTLASELNSLGADVIGGAVILAPHSFPTKDGTRVGDAEPEHGKGQPDESITNKLNDTINQIVRKIQNNKLDDFDIERLKITNVKSYLNILGSIPYDIKLMFMPKIKVDHSKCDGCESCIDKCETGSISLSKEGQVSINHKTCNLCYSCILRCPSCALNTNWTLARIILWFMGKSRQNIDTKIII